LFVIFARDACEAVVFSRGPSAWFQLIRWDTRHDTFDHGAWIRGTIYPERCDLSPDGRLLLYFVHQGRKHGTSYTSAWTGVSRTPWLDALALWPWGSTWGGGGRFDGNRKVILNVARAVAPHPEHPPCGLEVAYAGNPYQRSNGEVEGAQWSGRDQRGRLVFATDGRLCLMDKGGAVRVLADFNGQTPEPRPAPAWAMRPLA
jgi:hypothetical protein